MSKINEDKLNKELKNALKEKNMQEAGRVAYKFEFNQSKIKNELSNIDVINHIKKGFTIEFAQVIHDWAYNLVKSGRGSQASAYLLLSELSEIEVKQNKDKSKKPSRKGYASRSNYNSLIIDIKKPTKSMKGDHTKIDYIKIADVAIDEILNNCFGQTKKTDMEKKIGNAINDELRWKHYIDAAPGLIKYKMEDYRYSTYKFIKTSLTCYMNNISKNEGREFLKYTELDIRNKIKIGQLLLQLFIDSFGIISKRIEKESYVYFNKDGKKVEKHKTLSFVQGTPELINFLNESIDEMSTRHIKFKPMTVPPKKWTSCFEGGYQTLDECDYIISKSNSFNTNMLYNSHDLDWHYLQTNRIQSVPFKIDSKVYKVLKTFHENLYGSVFSEDGDIKMPSQKKQEVFRDSVLNKDFSILEGVEREEFLTALNKYKSARKIVEKKYIADKSKLRNLLTQLAIAKEYIDEPEVYFPWRRDERSRTYPIPGVLNPQADDLGRSLLKFTRGKKMTKGGSKWLAVHGANCFGLDKDSNENNYKWVLENTDFILAIANDPYSNTQWLNDADKPGQFLQFCFEWKGWIEEGENFTTTLPCSRDGSCNGLQWYAGMLLDEESGKLVNLTNNVEFQDIYKTVADAITKYLIDGLKNGIFEGKNKMNAERLLKFVICRKVAKRQTMTLVYNSKNYGWVEQFIDEFKKLVNAGKKVDVFGEDLKEVAQFFADVFGKVAPSIVTAAFSAMEIIEKYVEVAVRNMEGDYLMWKTEAGFPIYRKHKKQKKVRIPTSLNKKHIETVIKGSTSRNDIGKFKNSTPPDFIQGSGDANHLDRTNDKLFEYGINNVCYVHDDFAVLCEDIPMLDKIVRETFIEIQEKDLLNDFLDQITVNLTDEQKESLPPKPEKGNLDLKEVALSEFFFK